MGHHPPLFFALECHAPWPEHFPKGRILEEEARHLTLAFLGPAPLDKALDVARTLTPTLIGPIGMADHLLFLPKKHPRTASYHFELTSDIPFYPELQATLKHADLPYSDQPLLHHITIARHPEEIDKWQESFRPFPLFLKDLHLFESLGYSKYRSHFKVPVTPPFEEIPHTADIAFHIWGKTASELYLNAACALAFQFPPFFERQAHFEELSEVIIALNERIAILDEEIGCPFKAVSFHGEIAEQEGLLHWEMIVDV